MFTFFSKFKVNHQSLLLSTCSSIAFGLIGYQFFRENSKVLNANPAQEKRKILKVCVTGAAGHVGTALIPLLANGDVFGENVRIYLKLLDTPDKDNLMKGLSLELQDSAYPLLYGVENGSNAGKIFRDCDLAIFLGGNPRRPGMEIEDLLQVNGQIFKDQGRALHENAKKDVKCLVVTSPANTNALILQKYAPDISPENISSLSRLNQNRAVGLVKFD